MGRLLVTARHDDAGTLVRIYRAGERRDSYYVHAEDGDWRCGLPAGARILERGGS